MGRSIRLFLISMGILTLFSFTEPLSLRFKNFATTEGLSSNLIRSVFQDKRGFLWIGTYYGLNRYDGKFFKQFLYDPDDPNSFPAMGQRTGFHEDRFGYIWIGTSKGLTRYNPDSEKFSRFLSIQGDPKTIGDNEIFQIKADSAGELWISTRTGVSRYIREKNQFKTYALLTHEEIKFDYPSYRIHIDKSGRLWSWNRYFLYRYDSILDRFIVVRPIHTPPIPEKRRELTGIIDVTSNRLLIGTNNGLISVTVDPRNRVSSQKEMLIGRSIMTLYRLTDNTILLGTDRGLFHLKPGQEVCSRIDNQNQRVEFIKHIYEDRSKQIWIVHSEGLSSLAGKEMVINSISIRRETQAHFREINCIYEDRSGVLWLGTFGYGLYKYSPYLNRFKTIRRPDGDQQKLANRIRAIYSDNPAELWVGNNDGLYLLNSEARRISLFHIFPQTPEKLNSFPVNIIYPGGADHFWIGSWNGLHIFNRKNHSFTPIKPNSLRLSLTRRWIVFDIILDSRDSSSLWLASNQGVIVMDPGPHQITRVFKKGKTNNSLISNTVYKIYKDTRGNTWIGTDKGLNRLTADQKMLAYRNSSVDRKSISADYITYIIEDRDKNLWIGTAGGGLNRFNFQTGSFEHFTSRHGLANNAITGILSDQNGHLWISTYSGISHFDPMTKEFRNFYESDGLQKGDYNTNACFKTGTGELYFGGMNGLNAFYPDKIKYNDQAPQIRVTALRVDGKKISNGSALYLDGSGMDRGVLTLPYDIRNIEIEFAAFDYHIPESNRYQYRIEGKDDGWTDLKHENRIVFRSIGSGSYRIRIKAANHDGIWNEKGTYIHLIITPPFWQTGWFQILSILLFLGLIALLFIRFKTRLKIRFQKENALNEMYLSKGISKREKEIIELIVKGKSNKEIEDELFISIRTVNSHKYNIYKKLKVKNSGDLKYLIDTYSGKKNPAE